MTYEDILNRMLERVPNDVDKREGSIIYDALAPAAAELAQMYIQLDYFNRITYADEATEEYLTKRCAEKGIVRKQVTKSIRKGVFNLDIPIGSRFALFNTTYLAIEKIKDFEYKLECEQAGAIGNAYSGVLTAISNLQGVDSAQLLDVLIPGENIETDDSLRKRYFDSLESEAFGGNVQDYIQKTKSLHGVGGVKCIPVWNGGGTVKLIILGGDYDKPSQDLINSVQKEIDPIEVHGKGEGIAPIGHIVTVVGVTEIIINIESNITLTTGYIWQDVKPHVEKVINDYFKDLANTWDASDNVVVRTSHIESKVLQVTGILDIQSTKLNNSTVNLILESDKIPKLGMVTKS